MKRTEPISYAGVQNPKYSYGAKDDTNLLRSSGNKAFHMSPFSTIIEGKFKKKPSCPITTKLSTEEFLKLKKPSHPFHNNELFEAGRRNRVPSKPINLNTVSLKNVQTQFQVEQNILTKKQFRDQSFISTIFKKLAGINNIKKQLNIPLTDDINEDKLPLNLRFTDSEKQYLKSIDLQNLSKLLETLPLNMVAQIKNFVKTMEEGKEGDISLPLPTDVDGLKDLSDTTSTIVMNDDIASTIVMKDDKTPVGQKQEVDPNIESIRLSQEEEEKQNFQTQIEGAYRKYKEDVSIFFRKRKDKSNTSKTMKVIGMLAYIENKYKIPYTSPLDERLTRFIDYNPQAIKFMGIILFKKDYPNHWNVVLYDDKAIALVERIREDTELWDISQTLLTHKYVKFINHIMKSSAT